MYNDFPDLEEWSAPRDAADARARAALKGLTPAQHTAVIHRGSPQLILAGAGSGKTGVITRRIVHLIATGDAAPEEILGVTFTTKAANEIARRVESMLGEDAYARVEEETDEKRGRRRLRISLCTFHSAALRLLRAYHVEADLPDTFSVISADRQLQIVKQVLAEELGVSSGITLEQARAAMTDIEAVVGDPDAYEEAIGLATPLMRRVINGYGRAKSRLGVLDYTDLMVRSLDLMRNDDDVRNAVRERWRHVMVDEYQDTNRVQEAWLREIVGDGTNLTVVGDDDQILYTWRGAEAANILGFPTRYRGTSLVKLEENFRSVRNILECANGVISPARNRMGKRLIATRENGPRVRVRRFLEASHEAVWIARTIEAEIAAGRPASQIAVLARASHALNLVEQALAILRVPYQLAASSRFHDRVEIRNAMAWLRLVVNPGDAQAFSQAAQAPKRGLGKVTIEKITAAAQKDGTQVLDVARAYAEGAVLPATQTKALAAMLEAIDAGAREYWREATAGEVVSLMIEASGLRASLEAAAAEAEDDGDSSEADGIITKLSNLSDLGRIAGDMSVDEFLDHMGLGESGSRDAADGVFVGTAHAAKGLEWPRVILVGWEDNLLPDWRALGPIAPSPYANAGHPLDEERRIAFVMITRAMDELDITTSSERFGKPARPSRFLSDLPGSSAELWEMPAPARV